VEGSKSEAVEEEKQVEEDEGFQFNETRAQRKERKTLEK